MDSITPYAIPENREISEVEWELIRAMISLENTIPLEDIDDYKVIGRCGCGSCPTIFIGPDGDFEKIGKSKGILIDAIGETKNGHSVFATFYLHEAEIIEFEINYYTGLGEYELPMPSSLNIAK